MSVFDISKYQPVSRTQELVDQGNCDGMIIKLGERNPDTGEIALDPKFIDHVDEAARLGLPYGLYIMSRARNKAEALEEAQWVNDMVAEYLNGQEPKLGIWWDLEREEVKRQDIYEDVMAAINQIRVWWHTEHVGIYSSYYYFYDYLDLNDMKEQKVPVWLAQYNGHNGLQEDGYPYIVLWQFTTNDNTQDEDQWYGWPE